jgi:hypothetical protein
MKNINLGQTLSILANAGVIASLIFVGIQVQQGATATRSAAVLQLKDSWVQLNLAQATSVDLADAFHDIDQHGWDGANYRSTSLVEGFIRTLFHNWSNAYYQYQNGALDANQWGAFLREARWNTTDPRIRRVWHDWNHVYDDSFRELMDGLFAETDTGSASAGN